MPRRTQPAAASERRVTVAEEPVEVYPEAGMMRDTARALLDAADRVGRPQGCVEAILGGFRVPPDVAAVTVWPMYPTYTGRSEGPAPVPAPANGR